MPIDLKALQKRGAEIEIEFYGMTSTVEYDPTKFTPGFRAEYQHRRQELYGELESLQAQAKEKEMDVDVVVTPRDLHRPNASLLTILVKAWDIVGIDGKTLPLDPERILEELPDSLTGHIINEIWSDVNQRGNRKGSTPTSKVTAD